MLLKYILFIEFFLQISSSPTVGKLHLAFLPALWSLQTLPSQSLAVGKVGPAALRSRALAALGISLARRLPAVLLSNITGHRSVLLGALPGTAR